MSNLYEITESHKSLERLASDIDIDAQTIADTFEGIEGEFNDKAISVINVIANIGGDVDLVDEQIKRMQGRKKILENRKNSIKEYLRENMEATGITKIQHPLFSITLAKGRDAVSILNESEIPAEFLNIKTVLTPMKIDILKELKDGGSVNGCALTKSKSSLRIK